MARRSAPPGSGPAYVPKTNARAAVVPAVPEDESAFGRFLRKEVFAQEKRAGNISILTGVSMFIGGIVVARTWGELIVPV